MEWKYKGAGNVITRVKGLKIVLCYFPSLQNGEEFDSVTESLSEGPTDRFNSTEDLQS